MDVSSINLGTLTPTTLQGPAAVQVAAMNLDEAEETGESLKKMMEMSVTPNLGANIDISV